MTEFVKTAFIVVGAMILQALLSVSQLTSERLNSVKQLSGSYVFDLSSPELHITDVKQIKKRIEDVYSVKHRHRRSDVGSSLLATDLSKTINPVSAPFKDTIDKLKDADGSGELPQDVLPPSGEISEGIVDNNALPSSGESDATDATSHPRLTKMMPYARVVLPQQSTSLRVEYEANWPNVLLENNFFIGDIMGISINSAGNIILLHRGSYRFKDTDFSEDNKYIGDKDHPVNEAVLLELDAATGQLLRKWAHDLLYVPYGLSVDRHNNVWITDIALHQVMKFVVNNNKPSLVLGEQFEPGNDRGHFCQPTDVAVMNSDDIYVADGLCNNRIVRYFGDGHFKQHWVIGSSDRPGGMSTQLLSLTVNTQLQHVCVGRSTAVDIVCYDSNGSKSLSQSTVGVGVFAMSYNVLSGYIYAVGTSVDSTVVISVIEPHQHRIVNAWKIHNVTMSTPPYDIAVSLHTSPVYISTANPPNVWKFNVVNTALSGHQSVKKAGVKQQARPTHVLVDSSSDESADDNIEQSVEQPSIVMASLVVGSLIVVPLSVALVITICARLHKQGKLQFFGVRRHNRRLNLGNLLSHNRNGVGFHQLTTLDNDFHDELDPLRSDDSDIEEFSSIAVHQRAA